MALFVYLMQEHTDAEVQTETARGFSESKKGGRQKSRGRKERGEGRVVAVSKVQQQ